eukprot:4602592-Prymnesium_polylepis.1
MLLHKSQVPRCCESRSTAGPRSTTLVADPATGKPTSCMRFAMLILLISIQNLCLNRPESATWTIYGVNWG